MVNQATKAILNTLLTNSMKHMNIKDSSSRREIHTDSSVQMVW
jgi:hypothetical protein